MSLEALRERIKAEGLDNADYIGEHDNHIPDAGEKPWDSEPTPLTDQAIKSWNISGDTNYEAVYSDVARDLERRMRAAERLLEDKRQMTLRFQDWYRDADAHLEAAQKEDGR